MRCIPRAAFRFLYAKVQYVNWSKISSSSSPHSPASVLPWVTLPNVYTLSTQLRFGLNPALLSAFFLPSFSTSLFPFYRSKSAFSLRSRFPGRTGPSAALGQGRVQILQHVRGRLHPVSAVVRACARACINEIRCNRTKPIASSHPPERKDGHHPALTLHKRLLEPVADQSVRWKKIGREYSVNCPVSQLVGR